MAATQFNVGDLVWAKIKGFPLWPAQITETQTAKNKRTWVQFFGTHERACVRNCDLFVYDGNEDKYANKKNKRHDYLVALAEIREAAGLPPISEEKSVERSAPPQAQAQPAPPVPEAEVPVAQQSSIASPSASLELHATPAAVPMSSHQQQQPFDSHFGSPMHRRTRNSSLRTDMWGLDIGRFRNDSISNEYERHRLDSYEGRMITADFDPQYAEGLLRGDLGLDSEVSDDNHGRSRRRRDTSKMLDEYIGVRHRTSSFIDFLDSTPCVDPAVFLEAIDQLPSEESDRPQTPETIARMPQYQGSSCTICCSVLKFVKGQWRCVNEQCRGFNTGVGGENQLSKISGRNPSVFSQKKDKRRKKKHDQMKASPGRPRAYKVEKTPAVQSNGIRFCVNCNGHVRPQMCGGNKHRWRCVDKKCRKWYGWVRSHEEIPRDLGKRGRWKDLPIIVQGHTEDGKIVEMIAPQDDHYEESLPPPSPKRKRRRHADVDPIDPLTAEELAYRPTALEAKVRWWKPDRKRTNPSPEREYQGDVLDCVAAFKVAEQSMRSMGSLLEATTVRADDELTVGQQDAMVDALLSSALGMSGVMLTILLDTVPKLENSLPPGIRQKFFRYMNFFPVSNA